MLKRVWSIPVGTDQYTLVSSPLLRLAFLDEVNPDYQGNPLRRLWADLKQVITDQDELDEIIMKLVFPSLLLVPAPILTDEDMARPIDGQTLCDFMVEFETQSIDCNPNLVTALILFDINFQWKSGARRQQVKYLIVRMFYIIDQALLRQQKAVPFPSSRAKKKTAPPTKANLSGALVVRLSNFRAKKPWHDSLKGV